MPDNGRKLFSKDFDYLICKTFGKKKEFSKEEEERAEGAEEKFAVQMGLKEVNQIQSEIERVIESLKDLVLAQDLINELREVGKGFEYIGKIIVGDYLKNSMKLISTPDGMQSFKDMHYARTQWIAELLYRYGHKAEGIQDAGKDADKN